jgi:hypothetical protein
LDADAVVGWTCFIHSCTFVMVYYIFLKEHECILPTLRLVFTLFAIIVDGLPQIVHSWNFIFLRTLVDTLCTLPWVWIDLLQCFVLNVSATVGWTCFIFTLVIIAMAWYMSSWKNMSVSYWRYGQSSSCWRYGQSSSCWHYGQSLWVLVEWAVNFRWLRNHRKVSLHNSSIMSLRR